MSLKNALFYRKNNNNSMRSDYDIWRSSVKYNDFAVAILNFDQNAQTSSYNNSSNQLSDVHLSEFSSVKDLNEFLKSSAFRYTLLIPSDCIVSQSILDVYLSIITEHKDIDIIYSDEDIYVEEDSSRRLPFFKPSFSPDTLMSYPYMGRVFLFRTSLVDEVGLFDESLGKEAYYDFLLKCFEEDKNFYHCPQVLFSQKRKKDDLEFFDANENIRICQENSLIRRKIFATMALEPKGYSYIIDYKWDEKPLVSIIIPSKDNYPVLERCINSILDLTSYENYEIVVVDNGSSPENKELYKKLLDANNIQYIYEEEKFNFSHMCNVGVSHAKGEYYLFLNDDIEVIDSMWLLKILSQAMLPHSGAVGAKLLFGDRTTIQHCGVITNVGPTHACWGFNDNIYYYFGRNRYVYNYLAVTGACMCVSKEKYEEVGGYNEDLSICYNDVDLCYKLVEHGYYNTVRNDVKMIHYESVSRGSDYKDEETEQRLLRERALLGELHPQFIHYDPFYNVNLTAEKVDFDLRESQMLYYAPLDLSKVHEVDSFMNIDSVEIGQTIRVRGWIVNKTDLKDSGCTYSIVLKSDKGAIAIKANRQVRTDVMENCSLNVSDVGFVSAFSSSFLEAGIDYKIGIMVTNASKTYQDVSWSEKSIRL